MKQFVFPCVIRIHLKILWIPGRPVLLPSTTLHENWACSFSVQTEFQVIQLSKTVISIRPYIKTTSSFVSVPLCSHTNRHKRFHQRISFISRHADFRISQSSAGGGIPRLASFVCLFSWLKMGQNISQKQL